jgi:hypothetical protein
MKKLRAELASAHADTIHVREIWTEQSYELWEEHKREINNKDKEILKLKEKIWDVEKKKMKRSYPSLWITRNSCTKRTV